MDLRYRLAVVTDAGAGLGREIAVAVSRVGAAVLSADPDLAAALETAARVGEARVKGWALQADVAEERDLLMLVARARDLGGMDLLVTAGGLGLRSPTRLTRLFVEGLTERRGRRDGSPAVVHVCGSTDDAEHVLSADRSDVGSDLGARVMAVVPGRAPASAVTRVAVRLLCHGAAGEVVQVAAGDGQAGQHHARRHIGPHAR